MLISISVIVAILFFLLFIRAVRGGQYDDTYTPGVRILFEDELVDDKEKTTKDINKTTK